MPDDHVTLPVAMPTFDHLSTDELGQLRAKIQQTSREARRKAIQVIQRFPALKGPWNRSLNLTKARDEEKAQVKADLEHELLRAPEAYLAHAWANALVLLDLACREELFRRTGSANQRKKAPTPASSSPPASLPVPPRPAPPPSPQVPRPVSPPAPELAPEAAAPKTGADALAAMFDGADDD